MIASTASQKSPADLLSQYLRGPAPSRFSGNQRYINVYDGQAGRQRGDNYLVALLAIKTILSESYISSLHRK